MNILSFISLHCIGEANSETTFITSPDGADVAMLVRITPDVIPVAEHKAELLNDEQWQLLINLVDAAPNLLEACQELVKWLYRICTDDVKLVLKHAPNDEHLSLTNIQALLDSIQNPACNAPPGKVELATYSVQIREEIVATRDFEIQARSAAHAHRLAYDFHVEKGKVQEPPAIAVNDRLFIITTPSGEEKEFLDNHFETLA